MLEPGVVVCVAFKFQPSGVAAGRDLPGVGAGAGAGWRAARIPSRFPWCCFPLVSTWHIDLTLVLVRFFPPLKTSQTAPGADCGPLSERAWFP